MQVTNGLSAEMLDTILLPPLYGLFPFASCDLVCGFFFFLNVGLCTVFVIRAVAKTNE